MKLVFETMYANKCVSGWRIQWVTNYHYSGGCDDLKVVSDVIEKFLDINLVEEDREYYYYPKDEADEAFFLCRLKTIEGESFEVD